jgi:hypothetical protein
VWGPVHFLSSNTVYFVIQSIAIMAIAYLLFTNPQKSEGRRVFWAQPTRPCTVFAVRHISLYFNNQYHTCKMYEMPQKNITLFSSTFILFFVCEHLIHQDLSISCEPPAFVNSCTLITSILLKTEEQHNLTKVILCTSEHCPELVQVKHQLER